MWSVMVVGVNSVAVSAHQVQSGRCMTALGSSLLMIKHSADM